MLQSFAMEIAIGTLAAVGAICIIKSIYDMIVMGPVIKSCNARLTLIADGCNPDTEQLIRMAQQVKRLYFPGLTIVFVDTCGTSTEKYNYARRFAKMFKVEYIAPHKP